MSKGVFFIALGPKYAACRLDPAVWFKIAGAKKIGNFNRSDVLTRRVAASIPPLKNRRSASEGWVEIQGRNLAST
jgi:hypothetical protein